MNIAELVIKKKSFFSDHHQKLLHLVSVPPPAKHPVLKLSPLLVKWVVPLRVCSRRYFRRYAHLLAIAVRENEVISIKKNQ